MKNYHNSSDSAEKYAKNALNLIVLLCRLQGIKEPEVYFLREDDERFVLYDHGFNIISYDRRDVSTSVTTTKYVFRENSVYINTCIFDRDFGNRDTIPLYLCRTVRGMYQCIKAKAFHDGTDRSYEGAKFHYVYYEQNTQKNSSDYERNSLLYQEIDKNVFTMLMMHHLYGKNIRLQDISEKTANGIFNDLSRRYTREHIRKYFLYR